PRTVTVTCWASPTSSAARALRGPKKNQARAPLSTTALTMTTRSGTVIAWSPPCPLAIAVDLDLRRPRCGHRPHSPPRPGQDRRGGDRQACCPDQDPRRERLPAEAAHAVGRRRREREAVRIDPEKFVQVGGCAEQPESREAPPGPGLPTAQGVMGNEHAHTQARQRQDGGAVHVAPGVRVDEAQHPVVEAGAYAPWTPSG